MLCWLLILALLFNCCFLQARLSVSWVVAAVWLLTLAVDAAAGCGLIGAGCQSFIQRQQPKPSAALG